MFGAVVPAHIYPLVASIHTNNVLEFAFSGRGEEEVLYGLPGFKDLCDDGFFCVVGVGEHYPVT